MKIVGLDLSKANSALAGWDSEKSHPPMVISKSLGDGNLTKNGTVFARLHMMLNDANQIMGGIDKIYCEEPLQPTAMNDFTTFQTVYLAYGLGAHAESFAAAKSIRFEFVNQVHWRRHFFGSMKRGTKTAQLKAYAMERAKQLGFKPKVHDEADAIGVLDYGCELSRVMPSWRKDEVLRPPLLGIG